MKEGDFLICKKTCYSYRDAIFPNKEHPKECAYNFFERINNRIFKNSIYKKGKRYKIDFIYQKFFYLTTNGYYVTYYRIETDDFYNDLRYEDFTYETLCNTFVTYNELRKLKLQKLRKL